MRILALVLVACFAATAASAGPIRIADDIGGKIGAYTDQYVEVRNSGEQVVIDGTCLSACTLVLGIVPRARVCATNRAVLGFHTAWFPGPNGRPIQSNVGTQLLWEQYPQDVRRWINDRGGLTPKMKHLRGKELFAMVPRCKNGAEALARAPVSASRYVADRHSTR